jgi:hypothetical protein
MRITLFAVAGALALSLAPVFASWNSDANVNTPLVTKPNDQVQPKIRPTPDGGFWLCWLDNAAGGYDTFVQRVDRIGDLLLPAAGVMVVNTSFSSTEDYGFDVDPVTGIAWVAFRDDRTGSVVITVNGVTPAGSLVWGAAGVTLANSAGGASPRLAVTPGGVVAAWAVGNGIRLQKLDAAGLPLWGAGVVQNPPGGSFELIADLHATEDGGVILSWVRYMARGLYTQKYDAGGAAVWNGGSPRAVFTAGAIQFGNFPEFTTDGAGGAVFSWYDTGGARNAYVQRINAAGNPVLAINGVAVNTTSGRIRLNPAHTFNPAAGDTFVFWVETNLLQTAWGVYGQKITSAGVRAWGDAGVMITPLDAQQDAFVCAEGFLDGALAFWLDSTDNGRVLGTRFDKNGGLLWTQYIMSGRPTGKGRLESDRTPSGMVLLTWEDGPLGALDLYATNVNPPSGMVGRPIFLHGDLDCDADVDLYDIDPFVLALGGQTAYEGEYPTCFWLAGDADSDGDVDFFDIDLFVELLGQ